MINKDFVLAGKAIFTIDNGKGTHYTYKVTHKEATGQYNESWFVSLLTGPDNTSNYTYLGMLNPFNGAVSLTRKSKFDDLTLPVRVIRWALNIIWSSKELPTGYNIRHEGRCGRCGRVLTVPESIDTGIGPECAKLMSV